MSYKLFIKPFLYTFIFQIIFTAKLDTNKVNEVLLAQHNKYRKMHDAPELTLDNELIKLASDYSAALAFKSDIFSITPSGSKNKNKENLGENIFTCTSVIKPDCYDVSSTKPVDEWYNEINNYNYEQPGFTIDSSHFSQLVWKETSKMGCGASVRDDGVTYKVVCNYYTAGNILSSQKFEENVLPLNNDSIFIILNSFYIVLSLLNIFC